MFHPIQQPRRTQNHQLTTQYLFVCKPSSAVPESWPSTELYTSPPAHLKRSSGFQYVVSLNPTFHSHIVVPPDRIVRPCSPDLSLQMVCRLTPTRLYRSLVTENHLFCSYLLLTIHLCTSCVSRVLQDISLNFLAETTGCLNFIKRWLPLVLASRDLLSAAYGTRRTDFTSSRSSMARFYIPFIIPTFTQTVSASGKSNDNDSLILGLNVNVFL